MASPSAQQPLWAAPSINASANTVDSDVQAWGLDSNPPGGFVGLLNKNIPSNVSAQPVNNGNFSQPIDISEDTNGVVCGRIEKRMLWTKHEDRTLVKSWVNNSMMPSMQITRRTNNIGMKSLLPTMMRPQQIGQGK